MSTPPESDPFNPSTWPKTNLGQNPNEPQPLNTNQQQVPPNYNQQQVPPNYNQQNQYQQNPNQQNQYQQNPNQQNPYAQNFPQGAYQPYGNPYVQRQMDLPASGSAQVCGIIGIVLFASIIGVILNIIAIVNGAKAMEIFERNPGAYTSSSYSKAKAGRTCGIVGLCLLGFGLIVGIGIAIIVNS